MTGLHVLVVDDSALMRRQIAAILEDAGHRVSLARDGRDALEKAVQLDPDVVTLDIHMPEMDGLTCLSHLMIETPRPVVMVSSLTEKGALATLEALALGAIDYVAKPGGTISVDMASLAEDLIRKVEVAAGARRPGPAATTESKSVPARPAARTSPAPEPADARSHGPGLIVIGVSTGGPRTLESILPLLPDTLPWPVVVVQHMPGSFTSAFARRMDGLCALQVREVTGPVLVEPGVIHIARGDSDLSLSRRARGLTLMPMPEDPKHTWHPSVSRLLAAVAEHVPAKSFVGVLLTGMGDDGAAEMACMHESGGFVIAESEQTAVVYGMPKALMDLDGADEQLPMQAIAGRLCDWFGVEPRHVS